MNSEIQKERVQLAAVIIFITLFFSKGYLLQILSICLHSFSVYYTASYTIVDIALISLIPIFAYKIESNNKKKKGLIKRCIEVLFFMLVLFLLSLVILSFFHTEENALIPKEYHLISEPIPYFFTLIIVFAMALYYVSNNEKSLLGERID